MCDYLLEFIYIFFYLSIFNILIPAAETQRAFGYQEEIDEDVSAHNSSVHKEQKI
jgi:hypothetical protein